MAEQLWRAVAVYRVAALGYAAILMVANHRHYAKPALGWALLGVMAAWTIVTVIGYAAPTRRTGRTRRTRELLLADVVVALALVLATLAVETSARIAAGAPTLPAVWVAAPVLACAVAGGPWWGAAAAAAISAADIIERGTMTQPTFNGIVLLLLGGLVGGYVVRRASQAELRIASSVRREAVAAERERLARDIHDSVLQVLALVARRGAAIGGEAAELAQAAGEQEAVLRALVAAPPPHVDAAGELDLRSLVEPLASSSVTVACPAAPVGLAEPLARELSAAVREALANVSRHAGDGAHAWVLVEDDGDAVTVSVRDNGVGMSSGRLGEAHRDGRLGVAQSIVARVRDVGGSATLTSSPGTGTEVELHVPRRR